MTWLTNLWDRLKSALWFVPALCLMAGLLLGVAGVWLEWAYPLPYEKQLSWIRTTASNSQMVLSALVGALMTVIGLIFSLTMVALSQTGAQYGPRLIRIVIDSTRMQVILGAFLGTALFTLIVLRSITTPQEGPTFVPHVSVLAAQLASIACICLLVDFTSYIGRSLRAEYLIIRVARQLASRPEHVYPRSALPGEGERVIQGETDRFTGRVRLEVLAGGTGYLQAVDLGRLLKFAGAHELLIDVPVRPGHFRAEHQGIARVLEDGAAAAELTDERIIEEIRGCFIFGAQRTPRQDPECALMELTEMAVRALSPGLNDPVTAINVVDNLSANLAKLSTEPLDANLIAEAEGKVRLRVKGVGFPQLLDSCFHMLRQNSDGSVTVTCRLLEGLAMIAEATEDVENLRALQGHADRILRQAEISFADPTDLADIRERYTALRASGERREASGEKDSSRQ